MFAEPKDAATLVVMKENPQRADSSLEILMLLRSPASSFVPSTYVFPGGGLDDEDADGDVLRSCAGFDQGDVAGVSATAGDGKRARALWVASIRETFEETGLLYAYTSQGDLLTDERHGDKMSYYREKMRSGAMSFKSMIEKEGLTLATERIRFISHWVTPFFSPVRYSAYFFAATAPGAQQASHDGIEIVRHLWISPGEALERNKKRGFSMVMPTVSTLKSLESFTSPEEALLHLSR